MSFNVAIDGPAGAGKSTIAKAVAKQENLIYVDTGAMYRALGVFFINNNIDITDENAVSIAVKDAVVSLKYIDGVQHVFVGEEDVTGIIRTENVSNAASVTSAYTAVRNRLLALQQNMAASTDVIMDGRDIGTVILPNANLKVFLTASVECRAKRRYNEYLEKGESADLEEIKKDIADRDYRDMNREIAPLKQADDAILVDSSDMTIDEVVDEIRRLIGERR